MASRPPVVEAGDDLVPEYTEKEERELTERLRALHFEIERGAHRDRMPPTVDYLCALHRELFRGVRSFAGRVRRPGYGSEMLSFGPNRSVHGSQVERELESALVRVRSSVLSVLDNPEAANREPSAIRIAVWAHAEVIRIHPFQDGNGRTSRLLLDAILDRLGLWPIPIEEVRQTYCVCLNHYMGSERDIGPLVDLYIRLAAEPS